MASPIAIWPLRAQWPPVRPAKPDSAAQRQKSRNLPASSSVKRTVKLIDLDLLLESLACGRLRLNKWAKDSLHAARLATPLITESGITGLSMLLLSKIK
jgi:hypothetical protein